MIPAKVRERALSNLLLMSRTAHGVVDVSASPGKRDVMLVSGGEEAAERARENFLAALDFAWEAASAPLEGPGDVRGIIEGLARRVNRGILRPGFLLRAEDSPKHPYMPAAKLEGELDWFCGALLERLAREPGDPVEEAAFVEYIVNCRAHFFADGCGKCAMAGAAWVLFRRAHPLPEYRGGSRAFYSCLPAFVKAPGPMDGAERAAYGAFLDLYRGLF